MSLHKHEKMEMKEKTSKTEYELHVYSRKKHLQKKEYSTLQQLHESNPGTNQNFTSYSDELSCKLPLVSSLSKFKFESIKNLDVSITFRKGFKTCRKHPMPNLYLMKICHHNEGS